MANLAAGVVVSTSDAWPHAQTLLAIWTRLNGPDVRGDLVWYEPDNNGLRGIGNATDAHRRIEEPSLSSGNRPVFILLSHGLGRPVRFADGAPEIAIWRGWLDKHGWGFVAILGEPDFINPSMPPPDKVPLTGLLFQLFDAVRSSDQKRLRVYDLRSVAGPLPDSASDNARQQDQWLNRVLHALEGQTALAKPRSEAEVQRAMQDDLIMAFDLPRLDPADKEQHPSLKALRTFEPLLLRRKDEVDRITRSVFEDAASVTIVAGASGTGKSSLLRVGAFATWFRPTPMGAGLYHGAIGLLTDPDCLGPILSDKDPVEQALSVRPLARLAEAFCGRTLGLERSDDGAQIGPCPAPWPGVSAPPEPSGRRSTDLAAALAWWQDQRVGHNGPIILVLDQVERVQLQLCRALECLSEREGVPVDRPALTLSPGWAVFLDLICRLSGLDGGPAADPRFRLVLGLRTLGALDVWPVEREGGCAKLPAPLRLRPIAALSDWIRLIQGTLWAYGLEAERELIETMALDADDLIQNARRESTGLTSETRQAFVLLQVKAALQRLLLKRLSLDPPPSCLSLEVFLDETKVGQAVDALGELAWAEWRSSAAHSLPQTSYGTHESRSVTDEIRRRFDTVMSGLVEAGELMQGRIELSVISRQGDIAERSAPLLNAFRTFGLITAAGPAAWRLPHQILLENWQRGSEFLRAYSARIKLKGETRFNRLETDATNWPPEQEAAYVDLLLNWVGDQQGTDRKFYEALWSTLLGRFDPTDLNVRTSDPLQRLPFTLLAAGRTNRALDFFGKVIHAPHCTPNTLGMMMLAGAEAGVSELVSQALKAGADVQYTDAKTGVFPLLQAAQNGHEALVTLLLEAGADANQVNLQNATFPLLQAAQQGHEDVVRTLLMAGADASLANRKSGIFALLQAAQHGHDAVIKLVLAAGAPPDQINLVNGTFPLLQAAQNGHAGAIELLLSAGVDVNRINPETGAFALLLAAQNGHDRVVERLLAAGGEANQLDPVDGTFPLLQASQNGHDAVVKHLLAAGADANRIDLRDGSFPLVLAAQNGHGRVVEHLITFGADVNQIDPRDGTFALLQAAQSGHSDVVASLLAAGAKANLVNPRNGAFPLLQAAHNGHEENIDLLLAAGADAGQVDANDGAFALPLAAQNGHQAVVRRLLGAGAQPSQTDPIDGTFPLLMAAQNGHASIVADLLAAGADAEQIHSSTGHTALLVANALKHDACVLRLLEAGAAVHPFIDLERDVLEALVRHRLNKTLGR